MRINPSLQYVELRNTLRDPNHTKNIFLTISNKFITFGMVKYDELFRLFKKDGWSIIRQKGSHVILRHQGKEVKKGLLNAILKQANVKRRKR